MASSQGLKIAIQVLLGIVIIALGIWLYDSITAPWAAVEAERAITAETRTQMDKVRLALIRHERAVDKFRLGHRRGLGQPLRGLPRFALLLAADRQSLSLFARDGLPPAYVDLPAQRSRFGRPYRLDGPGGYNLAQRGQLAVVIFDF